MWAFFKKKIIKHKLPSLSTQSIYLKSSQAFFQYFIYHFLKALSVSSTQFLTSREHSTITQTWREARLGTSDVKPKQMRWAGLLSVTGWWQTSGEPRVLSTQHLHRGTLLITEQCDDWTSFKETFSPPSTFLFLVTMKSSHGEKNTCIAIHYVCTCERFCRIF